MSNTEIHINPWTRKKARNGNGRHANYQNSYDPTKVKGVRVKKAEERRGRPRTTYIYNIKIVHDPLGCGAFASGKEFSELEYEAMLRNCAFTIGTSLIVDNKLNYVHSNGNGGQMVKRMKVE